METPEIKAYLIKASKEFLESRTSTLKSAILSSRLSSWEDTKSSAGDKYETSREMIQGEIDQNNRQLEEANKLFKVLEEIEHSRLDSLTIIVGSLVITNQGNFFIGLPLGMVQFENKSYALLSSTSPLGALIMGKKVGERFKFRDKEYIIIGIS